MKTTSTHRETRFEILSLQQSAGLVRLVVAARDPVRGPNGQPASTAPPLDVGADDLTAEEWAYGVAFFTALEQAYADRFDDVVAAAPDPVKVAADAEKARLDTEKAQKELADLDARIAAKRRELSAMDEPGP